MELELLQSQERNLEDLLKIIQILVLEKSPLDRYLNHFYPHLSLLSISHVRTRIPLDFCKIYDANLRQAKKKIEIATVSRANLLFSPYY